MLDALTYRKNLVLERQKEYQHSHKPIYYRPPRSRLYLGDIMFLSAATEAILTAMSGLYKTGFTLGVFGIAYSAYSLIKGKN